MAHLQGSRYELSQHVGIARNAGLTDQQINAILDTGDLDAANFSRTERTALDVTTELCTTHRLRDDTFARRKPFRRRGAHRIADDHQLLLRAGVGAQRHGPRRRRYGKIPTLTGEFR